MNDFDIVGFSAMTYKIDFKIELIITFNSIDEMKLKLCHRFVSVGSLKRLLSIGFKTPFFHIYIKSGFLI